MEEGRKHEKNIYTCQRSSLIKINDKESSFNKIIKLIGNNKPAIIRSNEEIGIMITIRSIIKTYTIIKIIK